MSGLQSVPMCYSILLSGIMMRNMFILGFVLFYCENLCYGIHLDSNRTLERVQRRSSILPCNDSSSDFQSSLEAFTRADTLSQLTKFNQALSPDQRFDASLGRIFGDNYFLCGLNKHQCSVTGSCFDFVDSNVSAWVYQSAYSLENFNNLLDNIYTGINLAEEDTTKLTPSLVDQVFKWKDPSWELEEVLTWLGFALTTVLTFGAFEVAVVAEAGIIPPLVAEAFGLMGVVGSAITPQVVSQIQLSPDLSREVGIDRLNAMFYEVSQGARISLEKYSNKVFAGHSDANNKNIVDIIGHGAYATQNNIPSQSQIESFYKSFLVAKAINAWWQQQQVYVISTTANLNNSGIEYPKNAAWYSSSTGRTYIPYYFDGTVPQEIPGILVLNGSFYGIQAYQVPEAIGRAWEVAPFNYTPEVAAQRIQASFNSGGSLQPFQSGAGWEGVFNLGVCDIQDHEEWVVPYGTKILPCCCGINCNETRAFVESVNLDKSFTWLHTCMNQLKGSNIDPSKIDYGIDAGSRASWWWHSLGHAKEAAFVICAVFLFIFFILGLVACCIILDDESGSGCCLFIFAIIIMAGAIAGIVYLSLKP